MKIVVIGGTGLIGSKVVEKLKQKGHGAIRSQVNDGPVTTYKWSAPRGVDSYDAVQLAICRACSSSNLTGLLYPSAEWRRLAL
jgi:nucleoside-diphosphate-sugar epimerase